VIALYGHNVAETQTVLWMRMLDRLAGPNPPKLICVDPRETPVARAATVHLAPLPGTNVAVMNGLLHEIIRNDWVDHDYIAAHTVGYEELTKQVQDYPPERVAEICQVPAKQIREAAHLLGTAQRLLSTVLQGFYQSHQATAAAVQVNNVNIIRGMLGKPGAGILQMNGQPTAENTRECGADGDLPGFRNWANDSHVAELARIWNIEQMQIPHYSPPTHLMQIMRYVEQGTIRFLWVSGTNPAVSLPELRRIRSILSQQRLFLVVQDIFLTETTALADVVLPAATWGEKTGTFTNADRTVHLSEKAVEPPGQARPDLDIFWTTRGGWTSGTKTAAVAAVARRRVGVRGVEAVQRWPSVRLHRAQLREAAWRQRHPVALHCRAPGRDRTALRRRPILERAGVLRELRQRPDHRGAAGTHRVPGYELRRQSSDQSG
jgi:anaerobic selenocysteine-containing dehydrogenase